MLQPLGKGVLQRAAGQDIGPGVVDPYVDTPAQRSPGRVDQPFDLGGIGQVGQDDGRLAAQCGNLCRCFGSQLSIAAMYEHVSTRASHRYGDRAADAAGAAGDDGGFVEKLHGGVRVRISQRMGDNECPEMDP